MVSPKERVMEMNTQNHAAYREKNHLRHCKTTRHATDCVKEPGISNVAPRLLQKKMNE